MENIDLDSSSGIGQHAQPRTNQEQAPPPLSIQLSARNGGAAAAQGTLDDDDVADGNHLPDVEEYKAQHGRETRRPRSKLAQKRCKRRFVLALTFAIVVAVCVTIGVLLGRESGADSIRSSNSESTTIEVGGDYDSGEGTTPIPLLPSRRERIDTLVSTLDWSDPTILYTPGSAQYEAVTWLAERDPGPVEIKDSTEFRQRYALTVLYYSLNGIENKWYNGELPWLTKDNVCQWRTAFPTLRGEKVEMGIRCKAESIVKEIYLPSAGAEGTIPDEIKLLDQLEGLFLNDNEIHGTITQDIAFLTNLRNLDLSDNYLGGTFPEFLGVMPLETLDLSYNYLTGKLPLLLDGLSSLQTFNVADNDIADNIEKLQVLNNVRTLNIMNNSFVGIFDRNLLSKWQHVELLDLSNNEAIRGPLPDNLFEMPSLKVIDLHGNYFNETIPSRVMPESEITFLALHDNALTGNFNVITQSMTQLTHLDLSGNWFTGSIPSFESMSKLRYFDLTFNSDLDGGPIPESLTSLENLEFLSLRLTRRTGSIPSGFSYSPNLAYLDFSYNHLTGGIPDDLSLAESLQFLLLSRNEELTGTVPEDFQYLMELKVLLLDRTNLIGPVNTFCDNKPATLQNFISDCEEIGCSSDCCTKCCVDGDQDSIDTCDDITWNGEIEPVSQYEFKKAMYEVTTPQIIFPTPSLPSEGTSPVPPEETSPAAPDETSEVPPEHTLAPNDEGDANEIPP